MSTPASALPAALPTVRWAWLPPMNSPRYYLMLAVLGIFILYLFRKSIVLQLSEVSTEQRVVADIARCLCRPLGQNYACCHPLARP